MIDLTRFQRDTLTVLAGLDAPNGLEINAELEDYHDRELNQGQVYKSLNVLIEMGLVSRVKKDDREYDYSLTNRGVRELRLRRDWEDTYVEELVESSSP